MESAGILVSPGLVGSGDLRDGGRDDLHVQWELVCKRARHELGKQLADRLRKRQHNLGRRGNHPRGNSRRAAPEPVRHRLSLEVPPLEEGDRVGGHLGVLQDFVAAVQGGPLPETVGSDNIDSFAMVVSATRSAESGQRVAVEV
jgi:predicted dehydrogenase